MAVLLEPEKKGYVILPLAEYERLREIERRVNETNKNDIESILKRSFKNGN